MVEDEGRLAGERIPAGRHNAGDPPIYQISKPVNFGTSNEDAEAVIRDIEAQRVKPVFVVVDTLSATLNGGEENGAGMSQFLANCLRIANYFDCFVLAVHHVGHNAEGRERGHSSLKSNVDTRIFCQKPEKLKASVVFKKVKDGDDNITFDLRLEIIPFGLDEDGDPITTLAVTSAAEVDADAKPVKKAVVPPQERLLRDMVELAMIDTGFECRPFPDGPKSRWWPRRRSANATTNGWRKRLSRTKIRR